jgi:hypothetical protein
MPLAALDPVPKQQSLGVPYNFDKNYTGGVTSALMRASRWGQGEPRVKPEGIEKSAESARPPGVSRQFYATSLPDCHGAPVESPSSCIETDIQRYMTFTLLRAGLPNTIVAAALAAMPIVAILRATPERAPHAPVQTSVAAASQPDADRAITD